MLCYLSWCVVSSTIDDVDDDDDDDDYHGDDVDGDDDCCIFPGSLTHYSHPKDKNTCL